MDRGLGLTLTVPAQLEEDGRRIIEIQRTMPAGINPYEMHFKETEIDHFRWRDRQQKDQPLFGQIPLEFGTLSHRNGLNGMYYCRWFTGRRHGIERTDDPVGYELAKYSQAIQPRVDRTKNCAPGEPIPAFTEQDRKLATLALFPRIPGIITNAPFMRSKNKLQYAECVQTPGLFTKFMNFKHVFDGVLEYLYSDIESMSNLSRACQLAFNKINEAVMHFDTTGLNFLHCDKSSNELDAMVASGELSEDERDNTTIGHLLIVSPVRNDPHLMPGCTGDVTRMWPSDMRSAPLKVHELGDWYNKHGFQKYPAVDYDGRKPDPVKQFQATLMLCKTFYHHGFSLRNLQLHRQPFIDVPLIEAFVGNMPSLKRLGIYQCQMIHFGKVKPLVSFIGATNVARKNQTPIELDVFPNYHPGPVGPRQGSYGIAWSDPRIKQLDSNRGISAGLISIIRVARQYDIELLKPGCGFRLFLDKMPFGLGQTVEILESVESFLDGETDIPIYAKQVYPDPTDRDNLRQLKIRMKETLELDLITSTLGGPYTQEQYDEEGRVKCACCGEELPGAFFRRGMSLRAEQYRQCDGCELNGLLCTEIDHNKHHKREITRKLFENAEQATLEWLLSDEEQAVANREEALSLVRRMPGDKSFKRHIKDVQMELKALEAEYRTYSDHRLRRPTKEKIEALERKLTVWRVQAGLQQEVPATCDGTKRDMDWLRKQIDFTIAVQQGRLQNYAPHGMLTYQGAEDAWI
ncbi:hypothetical protein BJ170DRAFT_684091 [Xylariales sp. AK1849]|nr:hypothetical protein BJ170DRAFT_684091 [Xylariales sp. AK1849]